MKSVTHGGEMQIKLESYIPASKYELKSFKLN